MSSQEILARQQKMMGSWCGHHLDGAGVVRVLNEGGSKPPILWIFNTANEPEALASVLGSDQPLVFTRSAHLMVPPDQDPAEIRNRLADHFLTEVDRRFGGETLNLGTSCQGTGIALRFAQNSWETGILVNALCIINCSLPDVATGLPALLVYGSGDPLQDPFSKDAARAEKRAAQVFSNHQRCLLDAGHGQFYDPRVLKDILREFAAFAAAYSDIRVVNSAASSDTVG